MAYDVETEPGGWLSKQVNHRERAIGRRFLFFGVSSVLSVLALAKGQPIIGIALIVAAACFAVATNDLITACLPWMIGRQAETQAGAELESLRYDGYIVMHDVMWGGQGNLDHVVIGPNNAFLIETKAGRYELAHLGKLKHLARLLHDELGCWVTPVMCSGSRRKKTFTHNKVLVASRGQLADAIRAQPPRGRVDFERVHRWADELPS